MCIKFTSKLPLDIAKAQNRTECTMLNLFFTLLRLLYGREEMPARWKFCIAYVNGNLGMAVGALFVNKYFDGQSKQDVS